MRVAIDAAGRIVVPKVLRDELGLTPGDELDVRSVDRHLEIALTATASGAELVTLDVRALGTYARCGANARLLV